MAGNLPRQYNNGAESASAVGGVYKSKVDGNWTANITMPCQPDSSCRFSYMQPGIVSGEHAHLAPSGVPQPDLFSNCTNESMSQ
jgi:hypothetical protein